MRAKIQNNFNIYASCDLNFNSSVMQPQDPNRTFYILSDGPTPVYFAIMCQLQI